MNRFLRDTLWILIIAACIIGAALLNSNCSNFKWLLDASDDMPDAAQRESERESK
jgi:hypothetical protein